MGPLPRCCRGCYVTSDTPSTAGDELLRWASEAGSGSWERLRDACAYVAQKHSLTRRPWTLASDLAALGHLDVDWETRAWSIAPPALNLVPGLGLCIVLTGSRPHYLDRRFEEATNDQDVYPFDVEQLPLPAARYAKCASVDVARRVAERLDATLVIDPAGRLVDALVPVDEEPVAAAPEPSLGDALRFDPATLEWDAVHQRRPGLYRIDLHGRPVHRRLDEFGSWWATDLPAGQFLALKSRTEPVLRWRAGSGSEPSYFEVRQQLSLPVIVERAATVSSGLASERIGGWRRYRNVPRTLANRIGEALLQQVAVA